MNTRTEHNGFIPAWWCPGAHLQTMWRRLFGSTPSISLRRERWETPDNDFLDLDFLDPLPSANNHPGPTLLLLHGLEGSSQARYILGMLREIQSYGWRGVALNFRSCSGEINRQRRFYHSGETTDLDWVVQRLIRYHPGSPLGIVGFSLGGSVLLKWLGERGDNIPPEVQSAVAISAPFDLGVAARAIDRGFSRVYAYVFLKTLKQKAILKARQYPGLIDPERVSRISSFAEFDDTVTAPFHGFRDGLDYWTTSSSKQFLGGIRRPVLLINSRDDPFLAGGHLPVRVVSESKWLTGEFTRTGGHAGFVEGIWPWTAGYWTESRVLTFLGRHFDGN